jgi:multidrug efflux system outer membrane protein
MLRVGRCALAAASLQLAGCMVGPHYVRPPVVQPAGFKAQAASEPAPPIAPDIKDWWRLYSDPNLDQLIATATASNQTLKVAVGRVDEARALARIAASYLAPTISVNPSFSRARYSASRDSTVSGQRVQSGATVNDWLVPFDLTYEVDVWGRVRRGLQAARAQAVASVDDEAAVRLTVQTDVAQFYYTLRLLDAQVDILTQTVAAYQEQVRVLSVQLKTGIGGPVALYQAQAQLEATLAQQRDMQRARADQEHALAILCGQPAPSFSLAVNPLREASPPEVPAGLPATLLTRRPDVASAEQLVVAANAQIGVVTADFFPRFGLTGSAGFESAAVSSLFNWQSRIASIVPGLAQPIFQRGRLKANLAAAKAQHRQAVAAYVNQVLIAYGDVEDALTDLHALTAMVGHLREAVDASQGYLRTAQVQYKNGLVDYLVVIDAERTLLGNQLSLAQQVNLQLSASIHLIKALGGGWDERGQQSLITNH